jgi:mono/diheme cytochrome c family protein
MRILHRLVLVLLLCGQAGFAWAYPWDQDMVDQPSEKPQESVAPGDPKSVPIEGGEFLPNPGNEAEIFAAKDAAASIPNPVPATTESITRGEYFYQINCLVCHGASGRGDGLVGEKFTDPTPVDLNEDYTQDQADGQIFFTLTRGRVAMPFYRDALSQQERWDVINYIKNEFGQK